ncbi:hypothetical protein AYI68_g4871 [Smittium mucronatum]|uniref:Uncharacterized protein n=1 Tax=Smittium mucronatum TaxID=133383 RepID=A0A1R0GVY0_9FUNG|nr:hypothetical protein AYI68_g4871 [Smittium mucronatum]
MNLFCTVSFMLLGLFENSNGIHLNTLQNNPEEFQEGHYGSGTQIPENNAFSEKKIPSKLHDYEKDTQIGETGNEFYTVFKREQPSNSFLGSDIESNDPYSKNLSESLCREYLVMRTVCNNIFELKNKINLEVKEFAITNKHYGSNSIKRVASHYIIWFNYFNSDVEDSLEYLQESKNLMQKGVFNELESILKKYKKFGDEVHDTLSSILNGKYSNASEEDKQGKIKLEKASKLVNAVIGDMKNDTTLKKFEIFEMLGGI